MMTPWYEAAAPIRRIERDLPANRLRVVGSGLESDGGTPTGPAGWTPELAPEFSEVDRARREGYEAGQREATERMVDIERQRLHNLASAVGDTARKIEAERFAAVRVAENDVVEFALQLAEAIIGRELELSTAPWRDAIRRCLQLAPPETEIKLRLHPDDAIAALADQALMNELSTQVRIVADHTVERSGAVAEAGACRIDSQISSAVERVRVALLVQREES
jgi:flagellar assembly protein FliH